MRLSAGQIRAHPPNPFKILQNSLSVAQGERPGQEVRRTPTSTEKSVRLLCFHMTPNTCRQRELRSRLQKERHPEDQQEPQQNQTTQRKTKTKPPKKQAATWGVARAAV